jgi:hypothetical protein
MLDLSQNNIICFIASIHLFLLMISSGFWNIILGYIHNSWLVSLTFQHHCLKVEIVISILMDTDKLLNIGKTQPPVCVVLGALYPCFNLLNIMKRSSLVFLRKKTHHLVSLGPTVVIWSSRFGLLFLATVSGIIWSLNSLPAHWISREAEHMCALTKIILFD